MTALVTTPRDLASLDRASRHLWLAVSLSVLAFGVGASWDRLWHATHPFEDFWSPPHLFIYATHGLATVVLARIAVTPDLRRHFGAPIQVWPLPISLPPALALAAGGFAVVTLAGVCDSIWHTRFGLDETAWSLPHAMLGAGILTSLLGFASCRLALASERPVGPLVLALFALVLLGTTTRVLLGPLDHNHSLAEVHGVASLPALVRDASYQHVARIYAVWDLTRSHPLFLPLSAFVVGLALALARGLAGRAWLFLLVAGLATLLHVGGDRRQAELFGIAGEPANWLPIPFAVATAVAVLPLGDLVWAAAGLAYGVFVAAWWGASPIAVLLAAPLMLAGAFAGRQVYALIARPGGAVPGFVLGLGLGYPAVTGALDLFLRSRTP